MIQLHHQFALEMFDENGSSLGQKPVQPNWEPAAEWARFVAMRQAPLTWWPALAEADVEILPLNAGEAPYAEGFRATLSVEPPGPISSDFPLSWFKRMARACGEALVKDGKLSPGASCGFKLLAFESSRRPKPETPNFKVEESAVPPPHLPFDLGQLKETGITDAPVREADFPVFIPEHVLREAIQATEVAGACETGGILIGYLLVDEQGPGVAVLVTAQVPAPHTEAKCESLVFTAETWAAVTRVLHLRQRNGEMILGWWHSHPSQYWCTKCPEERRRECPVQRGSFLSAHDLALHETVFPQAFHLALLITNAVTGLQHDLFGWRRGEVVWRGFSLLRESGNGAGPTERRLSSLARGAPQPNA